LIADREHEITQIETSMAELNEIFRDLNSMVHDQQSLIDTIDSNIDEAHTDVKSGVEELEEAKEIQKNSKLRICLYVCIAITVLGLILGGVAIYFSTQ
jgi:t-SNARE complex subunit (syntaxin)